MKVASLLFQWWYTLEDWSRDRDAMKDGLQSFQHWPLDSLEWVGILADRLALAGKDLRTFLECENAGGRSCASSVSAPSTAADPVEGDAEGEGGTLREGEGQSMSKSRAQAIARAIVGRVQNQNVLPKRERDAVLDRMVDPENGPLTEEDMLALGRFSYRQLRRIKKKALRQADRLFVKALQDLKK